jgi:D-sedoheptulose 7-phosphate isomerase
MFVSALEEHVDCITALEQQAGAIEQAAALLANTISQGRKILICGNGGSASDAQHFAAELIGRFEMERHAWPAVALTTDTSILTAIGNDYGFDDVFSRQVQGLGKSGDAFIGISTSGHSKNVLRAATEARSAGMQTIGLLGRDGGSIGATVDHRIIVGHQRTARIQEAHILILHFWAQQIEASMRLTRKSQGDGTAHADQCV